MSTHRFILEPYKGIATRHTCPECHKKRSFARYIDTEGKIEFPPYVGRCNHEQSCGYHFTPKDFFEKNPEKNETFTKNETISYKKREMLKPLPTSYIDENIMRSSQKCYEANNLFLFLSSQFGETATLSLMEKYHVGTSKHWTGATVFWQVDNQGKVRTGKVTCRHPLRLGRNRDKTSDLAQKGSKTAGRLEPLKEKPAKDANAPSKSGHQSVRPANRDIKAMKT